MSRRGNQEGCISKRKNGIWQASFPIGYNEDGKMKRKYFYGKNRKEVANMLNAFINEFKSGTYIEESNISVNEWLEEWYKTYPYYNVGQSTLIDYENRIRVHIKPYMSGIKLKDLRALVIQNMINDLYKNGNVKTKEGLSPKTIKNIFLILHKALEQAVILDMLKNNPCKRVTLPKLIRKERRVLSVDEQMKIQNVCKNHFLGTAIILALQTGLRQGELLALTWEDIDFKEGSISINKQVGRLKDIYNERGKKTDLFVRVPKTENSIRKIYVAKVLLEELQRYKEKQMFYKKRWKSIYKENNLLFCKENGEHLDPATFQKFFKKILIEAEVDKANVHSMRHTFATRAVETNAPIKVVSQIMGHADVQTTLNYYTHISPELQKESMQKIANNFYA